MNKRDFLRVSVTAAAALALLPAANALAAPAAPLAPPLEENNRADLPAEGAAESQYWRRRRWRRRVWRRRYWRRRW